MCIMIKDGFCNVLLKYFGGNGKFKLRTSYAVILTSIIIFFQFNKESGIPFIDAVQSGSYYDNEVNFPHINALIRY